MKARCKSLGQRRRRHPSAPSSRALSISDRPTTETVIFEGAAPLINTFYWLKKKRSGDFIVLMSIMLKED